MQGVGLAWLQSSVGCHLPFQFKQNNTSGRQTYGPSFGSFPSLMQQAAVYQRETGLPSGTFIWFLWLIMGTHLPLCHFLQIKQFLRKGTHSLKYIVWFQGEIWFLGFLLFNVSAKTLNREIKIHWLPLMRNRTFLRIRGLVVLVCMLGLIVFKFSFAPFPVSRHISYALNTLWAGGYWYSSLQWNLYFSTKII